MRIRKYELIDLDSCAKLFALVFNSEPWNEAWRVSDAHVRIGDIAAAPKFLGVVAIDKEYQGFIVGNIIRIESNNIFELKEMCVRTEEQRKGVGTRLLSELKKNLVAAEIDSIFLQTSHETPAYSFYVKNGFCKEAHFSALTLDISD